MNRIDRLHAILTTLQSKRVVRAEDLATRFEVSLRTIYRDIRALEAGGIPIGAEAGVGYFLTEGFQIPPIMFTREEARAMLLAGKLVNKFTDAGISNHFNDALVKVKAVLDMDKKDELDGLENDILIHPFPDQNPSMGMEELQLDKVKSALSDAQVVSMDYFSGSSGNFNTREVEPVGLTYYGSKWHLIAFCRLRQDYRDFRLDRMSKVDVKSETYQRFKHPKIQDYIDRLMSETELFHVVIDIKKEVHHYLDNYKYQMGLVEEAIQGDKVRMQFMTWSMDYFARWLLMMEDQVEIVSPNELKEKTFELVKNLKHKYFTK